MKKRFFIIVLFLVVSLLFTGCFWPLFSHSPSNGNVETTEQTTGSNDNNPSTDNNTSEGGDEHSSGETDASSDNTSGDTSSTEPTSQGIKLLWGDVKSAVSVPNGIRNMFDVLDILLPEGAKLVMVSFNSMQAPRRYLHVRFVECGTISKDKYQKAKEYLAGKGYAHLNMNVGEYGGSLSISDTQKNVYFEVANDPTGGDLVVSIGYKDEDVENPTTFGIDLSKLGNAFVGVKEVFDAAGISTIRPMPGKGHYEVINLLIQDGSIKVEYNITFDSSEKASQSVKNIASLVGGKLSGMGSVLIMEETKYKGWTVETGAQDKMFEITIYR